MALRFSALGVRRSLRQLSSAASSKYRVINPATEELVSELQQHTPEQIREAFKKAVTAQKKWSSSKLEERIAIFKRFDKLLQERKEMLAGILTSETGKPLQQAGNEIAATSNRISYFIDNVAGVMKEVIAREQAGFVEKITFDPLGVIANISAWNYPYFVGSNVFVPALLTGNAVIYKPSEFAAMTGLSIQKLLVQSGLDPDLFPTIVGGGKAGAEILKLPVNGVFFTGSQATGQKIGREAGEKVVRVQLELGGKDPAYVTDDANSEKAAVSLADGAFYNTGQSCCSVERIYVHQKVYEAFLSKFVQEVKNFKLGDPTDKSTYIGPLTRKEQLQVLDKQVKDAVSKGAKLLAGGKRTNVNGKGYFFEPTVLVNVNHKMDVMVDESFGPIIGIQKVTSDDEAIALMNDTKYGLTSGVYTPDRARALKILSEINSGTVYWNACDRVSPYLPWTGRNGSGVGSTLSIEGIRAFVQPKGWHLINP